MEETEAQLSRWRLRGFRGQKREGKESRRNTKEGISWQMWELVGRLTRVSNLYWDTRNQVGKVGIASDE